MLNNHCDTISEMVLISWRVGSNKGLIKPFVASNK